MGWIDPGQAVQEQDKTPDLTPLPLPEPEPPTAPAEEPALVTIIGPEDSFQPILPDPGLGVVQEPAPAETPSESPQIAQNEPPAVVTEGDVLNSDSQRLLEDAIKSGDRHQVVAALAAVGVQVTDELLSKILVP